MKISDWIEGPVYAVMPPSTPVNRTDYVNSAVLIVAVAVVAFCIGWLIRFIRKS